MSEARPIAYGGRRHPAAQASPQLRQGGKVGGQSDGDVQIGLWIGRDEFGQTNGGEMSHGMTGTKTIATILRYHRHAHP